MAGGIVTDLLALALAAFEEDREQEALLHLLDAWRESRSERVAVLVEKLSTRLTDGLVPLPCEPSSVAMELQRPLDLPRMFGALQETADRGLARELGEQLGALRKWPADPRLFTPLRALARSRIAHDLQVLDALCDLFLSLRDPRALPVLRELLAGLPPRMRDRAERLGAIVVWAESPEAPSLEVLLDAKERALCDVLEADLDARDAARSRSSAVRGELLARVYASPEDDSARLVLADHLLEQGDPLGEFIMLQYSPQPDELRLAALLRAHRVPWQAPLGPLVDPAHTRFERGFPVEVRLSLRNRRSLPPPGPAWSTVQDLDWGWSGPPEGGDWLAHPHLRSVTRLRRTRAVIARRLGAHALRLWRLELRGGLALQAPDVFTALSGLPHLTWVELHDGEPRDVGLCAVSALARRLERFESSVAGAWSLVVTGPVGVTVEATLVDTERLDVLLEAVRASAGFEARLLRFHARCRLQTSEMRRIERAGADFPSFSWG
ncbi:TIGR02996 domain-containing protein [Pyxidicoccus xibeiensis]|uniref:TIGR02996 domain-containing protein n=1 Tax=Pyxidicoccus xibeiensis TaxID=2906759 RepID=UPI0020A71A05|nr:TIGR02996 domain-containing protein [Pyxidicoccus xibeiensis]MCP3140392.1 TIGR02996 domain-containing protein [Pyxidicoccus xibeiensis]